MKNKALIASILMLPILISIASACTCINLENTEQRLENAQYVFLGEVIDIDLSSIYADQEMQEATVRIMQYWKPTAFPEAVSLKLYATKDTGANCGYNFEENKEYLIYAYMDQETGKLTTNSCMGNLELSMTQSEIEELNKLTNSTTVPNRAEPIEENIFTKFFKWLSSLFS
ncbi:MAG: hypothetical protein AABX10_01550 [Nanoarchaeota archaeon]